MASNLPGSLSGDAVVQAVKAALETRKLTREEVKAIAAQAEAEAKPVGKPIPSIDEDVREVIEKKLKNAKKKWLDTLNGSEAQDDWAKATDTLRADICAILRLVKQINRGVLPDDWYKHWNDNQCAYKASESGTGPYC